MWWAYNSMKDSPWAAATSKKAFQRASVIVPVRDRARLRQASIGVIAKPFDLGTEKQRRAKQLRALMPVDDLMRRLTSRLRAEGETNTLVFFMSDNGFMWGEHGLHAKATPYDQSLRIPLMLRWDGHVTPEVDGRLAANIDVAPTILHMLGVPPPEEMTTMRAPSTAARRR